ncbi:MAG: hypothetical protein DCC55_09505 [Chloroflexi bacterium]|nr:MAG: hypothetical protein DCC55_09505 [Chloroflexota bacterium]
MEWAILFVVVIVLALLALYFFSRSRSVTPRTYPARDPDKLAAGGPIEYGESRVVPDSTKGDYTYAERDQHIEYDRIQERGAEIEASDDLSHGNDVSAGNR